MAEFTTVTQALDELGFGRVQWLLLIFCGLAWLADACETMLLSFLGPALRCAWHLSPGAESALTSVVFCGMLLGVHCLGLLSDAVGRRRGFLLSALLLGASGLASALAPNFAWLLLMRAVVGFALGGAPVAVTLFAEFCGSAGRGRWLLLMQSFWTLGTVLEALLAWAVLPSLGWRWLLGLSAVPLLALLALYPIIPESPHWLVAKRRYAEAEAVLQWVAAKNGHSRPLQLRLDPDADGPDRWATADLNRGRGSSSSNTRGSSKPRSRSPAVQMHGDASSMSPDVHAPLLAAVPVPGGPSSLQQQQHVALNGRQPASGASPYKPAAQWPFLHSLRKQASATLGAVLGPQLRRTSLLLYFIWSTNAISYYGLVLLTTALQTAAKKEECTAAGGPNLDSSDYLAILVTTVAEAPGLLAAALLVDGKGRRWTLRSGLLLCSAALAGLVGDPGHAGQLALLFTARAAIEGTFCVLYVYTPELYPTAVRSFGLALCNGCSRLGGFLAPYATVYLVESGKAHTAELLLAGLCGGAAVCAFLLPFETRGRDLQSSQLQLDGSGGGSGGDSGRQANRSPDGGRLDEHGVRLHRVSVGSETEMVPAHEQEQQQWQHAAEKTSLLPA